VAPSVQAAMAPGQGMEALGKGIGQAGQEMTAVANKLQEAQDYGVQVKAHLLMQKAFSEHEQFRAAHPDQNTWEADMNERIGKVRESLQGQSVSPFGKKTLDTMFDGWSQQAAAGVRLDATKYFYSKTRTDTTRLNEELKRAGRYDEVDTNIDNAVKAGVFRPEEAEIDKMANATDRQKSEENQSYKDVVGRISSNAEEVLQQRKRDGKFPGITDPLQDMRLDSIARSQVAQNQESILENMRSGIVTGDITRPEQIDQLGEGIAHPLTIAAAKHELQVESDHATKMLEQTPEYQSRIVGAVGAKLKNMDTTSTEDRLAVNILLNKIVPGPVKDHFDAELKRVINGDPEDPTALSFVLRQAQEAFKSGVYGQSKQEMTVAAAVRDKFLLSSANLKSLGLGGDSENGEIHQVLNAKSKVKNPSPWQTEQARMEVFRELWKPDKVTKDADPFHVAMAQAIRDGKEKASYQSPADKWAEYRAYGNAVADTIRWAKTQKQASFDDISKHMIQQIAPAKREDFIKSNLSPDPESDIDPEYPLLPILPPK